jgi:hypothetical protein
MRLANSLFAALAIVLIADYSALASIQIQAGDYIRMTDGLGGRGGVFNTQETNASTSAFFGDSFPTFCVEVSENVSLPGTYYVQALNSTASRSGNVLTPLAGWIYSNFLDGLLPHQAGLAPADTVNFNNSVQLAIWQQVINANPATTTPISTSALASSYISGGYNATWVSDILGISYSGSGHGVQIMNLRSSSAPNAAHIQDQLVRNAPELTSLVVWSLLVSCGLTYVARRRDETAMQ